MDKLKPIPIKQKTVDKLNEIAHMKIKDAIDKKTFNIDALVKNKRGITWDKEILFLANFYLMCIEGFEKMSIEEKNKSIIGKYLKKIDKMNGIC